MVRLREGTLARVDAVLDVEEDRAGLMRHAIEREIERREAARERQKAKGRGER
jgi:hypothetical protein